MNDRPIRVLLVEDDEDDYVLTRALLAEGSGGRVALDRVADYDSALAAITRREHDLYLVDYRLGGRTGLDLIREALRRGVQGPMILQTGAGDHAVDLEAMRAGAADYLVKENLDGPTLERAIRYALERQRAAEALRQARAELERRVAERTAELSAANERLAEADRRKDEFLATLAHELRNPLAPIRNAVHILRHRGAAGVPLDELTALLDRQVTHLAHLVDDLLDVSRITRGKVELRKQPVDLAAVASQTAAVVRPILDQRQHRLEVRTPSEPLWVEADPTRVEQVLTNLLTNAGKYTPPGGHILMAVGRDERHAVVRVADNGIGIRTEMLPRIFEMFQQADRVPGGVTEGLGIGLTLVKRLVELHGGRVEAHSTGPGQGSEFVVRLPIAEPGTRGEEPSSGHPGSAPRGPQSRRILVVDDNVDAAATLALVLRGAGHAVRVAHDGPAALAAARAEPPDVVLLDIGLPRAMSGYEVARQIRAVPESNGTTLVALTGYGSDEHQRRAREAGFDHYLTKPVDLDELNELLRP